MLKLNGIVKNYVMGGTTVEALKGIDIEFRRSEFVAVLGPSGCGKTTLLNIIGGLDRYTSGDLIVDGVSTKEYKDADWDIYRNKAIGFVFQTYNLIPHQTVLSNVELALTLSGVSQGERKKRAREALERVGLGDQLNKKPNQMSGGQMQRVAIARALINNPEILLADEPTGALDTETSVQIMEILKEIARDRLVIMVTHNPELAERYATRTILLLDGRVTDDSNPARADRPTGKTGKTGKLKESKNRKQPLSLLTALSLSMNNLLTKKARTILTGFAGSIGIIGIALILSLSSGMQAYIAGIERDTVTSYPLTIQSTSVDIAAMLSTMAGMRDSGEPHDMDRVYSKDVMTGMVASISEKMNSNDLAAFKTFLEKDGVLGAYTNEIQYQYDTPLYIYKADTANGPVRLHPSTITESMMPSGGMGASPMGSMMTDQSSTWQRLLDNSEVLKAQYDVLAGRLPTAWNEVVIIVDDHNEITDYSLYSLGLKDAAELRQLMLDAQAGKTSEVERSVYTYDELMGLTFKLVASTDMFESSGGGWVDHSTDDAFMAKVVDSAPEIKVTGILRQVEQSGMSGSNGAVGYTAGLMDHLLDTVNQSDIVKAQTANAELDVFTGKPFQSARAGAMPDISSLSAAQQAQFASLTAEQIAAVTNAQEAFSSSATYDDNLRKLGAADADHPSAIRIYPKDFASKGVITDTIRDYNKQMKADGNDEQVIEYTDMTGLLMSSVDGVISGISSVLIAFVAISLVVSSIMIGIITYISVLERTKEIGVLRSIGASKGDISRVFNAETLIVGFVAGALGIGITLLLCIPANAIIAALSGIKGAAQLPVTGAVTLILVSMALTFIAGLIPARMAAKKDPVVALRTE